MLVRSMNHGKLDMVKQEMIRISIDIPGIRELKWMGMGEFNSGDHYIYYCGQESHRRNGVAIRVKKKECEMQYLDAISKTHNDLCSFPRQTISITEIQVYDPTP